MKSFVYRTLAGIAASLALALPCAAQVSVVGCIFDSTNPQISDDPNQCPPDRKLDIVSVKTSWTQTLAVGGGGGGAGKVQVGPFVISKNLDRTSPGLFLDVVTGRHLRGVLIAVFESSSRGGFRRVFSFLLEDVLVSSLEFDAADSRTRGAMPVDLVGFGYAKLTVRDDVANVSAAFDFAGNRVP
ncbi:MAG TPA: type VI secretion system tube protein Hcp [Burkholderiales bacterium]|nr:type VI secretion system tube protein Hcp [Burkholderiales bacterium]